jgi:hypothetical protein
VPHKESDRSALKPAVPATIQANSPKPPTRTAVRGRLDADLEFIDQMCAFAMPLIQRRLFLGSSIATPRTNTQLPSA